MDIKQKDLIKFWTWCGFLQQALPQALDLNNIYRYAIPKLQDKDYLITLNSWANKTWRATIKHPYRKGFYNDAKTPTEALYQAILKVIDNEVK